VIRQLLATVFLLAACGEAADHGELPPPIVPDDNPTTDAAVELGRHLFYDERLSFNQAISCSSCHQQRFAFADEVAVSLGATDEPGVINAPSLANVAYASPLTWASASIDSIEEQLLGPMFGTALIEMGMTGNEDAIAGRLRSDAVYVELFEQAFGSAALQSAAVLDDARYALASFTRSLVSSTSPFDAFLAGDTTAISESARRGSELFYSSRLGCGGCHAGLLFTEASRSVAAPTQFTAPFHNTGLYDTDGEGSYPEAAPGLIAETGIARDAGRFRVPSLRNASVTAPYMHDGSVATLEDVIDLYAAGGRGAGRTNQFKSEALAEFTLTESERADLVAFLRSLTDQRLLEDPAHSNTW